jgi:hypothetical protein
MILSLELLPCKIQITGLDILAQHMSNDTLVSYFNLWATNCDNFKQVLDSYDYFMVLATLNTTHTICILHILETDRPME